MHTGILLIKLFEAVYYNHFPLQPFDFKLGEIVVELRFLQHYLKTRSYVHTRLSFGHSERTYRYIKRKLTMGVGEEELSNLSISSHPNEISRNAGVCQGRTFAKNHQKGYIDLLDREKERNVFILIQLFVFVYLSLFTFISLFI